MLKTARETVTLGGAVALLCLSAAAARAQSLDIPVCEDQRQLEQVIGSDGQIVPDGCSRLSVSVLESQGERLCLLDVSSGGDGIVDQVRDAALDAALVGEVRPVERAVALTTARGASPASFHSRRQRNAT